MRISKRTIGSYLDRMGNILINCIATERGSDLQSKSYLELCDYADEGELFGIFCPFSSMAFYNIYCTILHDYNTSHIWDRLDAKDEFEKQLVARTTPSASCLLNTEDPYDMLTLAVENRREVLNKFLNQIYSFFTTFIKNEYRPEPDIPDDLEQIETLYEIGAILHIFNSKRGYMNLTSFAREHKFSFDHGFCDFDELLDEFKELVKSEMVHESIIILNDNSSSEDTGDIEEDEI